jgi:hypothetical protein
MYKQRSTKRKNNKTYTSIHYRCKGDDRNPSTCRNGIRQDEIESFVNLWFTEDGPFAGTEIVETILVNGDEHSDEITEIEAEIHGLDLDDPDYDRKLKSLRAERTRLKELPAEPSKVEERPTGKAVGDVWSTLSDAAKRKYLISAGVKVHVRPGSIELGKVLTDAATSGGFTSVEPGPVIASGIGTPPLTEAGLIEHSILSGRLQVGAHHVYWIAGDPHRVKGTPRAIELEASPE